MQTDDGNDQQLNLEKVLLAAPELIPEWHKSFGLKSDRRNALISNLGITDDNSFFKASSETALTIFTLGGSDLWVQSKAAKEWKLHPRMNDNWSYDFFESLRSNSLLVTELKTPLRELIASTVNVTQKALNHAILIFELQANRNYGICPEKTQKNGLTYNDIMFNDTCKQGTKFDAVLLLTDLKLGKRIICIEAKLKSKQGSYQIRRGIEAAFFLTKNAKSVFFGWDYSYIFLHPPGSEFENDYQFVKNPKDAISNYGEELKARQVEPNNNFTPQLWGEFIDTAPKRIHELTWPQILQLKKANGWNEDEYHKKIMECQLSQSEKEQLVQASKQRFLLACT